MEPVELHVPEVGAMQLRARIAPHRDEDLSGGEHRRGVPEALARPGTRRAPRRGIRLQQRSRGPES